jgi:hypothetical protein
LTRAIGPQALSSVAIELTRLFVDHAFSGTRNWTRIIHFDRAKFSRSFPISRKAKVLSYPDRFSNGGTGVASNVLEIVSGFDLARKI